MDIIIAIISATIGIIATIFVSQYFYNRSVNKSLSIYIYMALPITKHVDVDVRESLKFYYQDIEVSELFQLQFLVANEGKLAIRDCIEPLSLILPSEIKVLDVNILHVNPVDRSVKIEVSVTANNETLIKFIFPLLNEGEFFIPQLLLDGYLDEAQLKFKITVDDLPPSLIPQEFPSAVSVRKNEDSDLKALPVGLLFIITGIVSTIGLYFLVNRQIIWQVIEDGFSLNLLLYFFAFLAAIGNVLIVTLGAFFIFEIGFGWTNINKPRLFVPPHLRQFPNAYSQIAELIETTRQDENNM